MPLDAAEIVHACLKTGDADAWEAFVQRFHPLIVGSISRVVRRFGAPSPALIDDLAQETYLRLCRDNCRSLREFEARHDEAIFGYLKVIAASVALDHFRARTTQKRQGEVPDDGSHPEASTSSLPIEQAALLNELERRLATSESERDCAIFWLHYRQGYTARDIAALPAMGLSQKGVESCLYRLTQSLRIAVSGGFTRTVKLVEGKASPTALGVMK